MRAFGVDPIVKEGFAISARQQGNAVCIKLTGNGDMETPAILNGYLKKVHGEAMRVRAHSVIVECDELYFMSSACIKCLATWIDGIVKLDPMERYKVKFQSNANLPWQRRSFEALRRFAPALVHVDSDSAPKTPAAAEVPGSGSTPIAAQRATTPPSPLRRKT